MLKASKSATETTALSRAGQQMLEKVEKSKKPVIAAIMGMCLGGGLEVIVFILFLYLSIDDKANVPFSCNIFYLFYCHCDK